MQVLPWGGFDSEAYVQDPYEQREKWGVGWSGRDGDPGTWYLCLSLSCFKENAERAISNGLDLGQKKARHACSFESSSSVEKGTESAWRAMGQSGDDQLDVQALCLGRAGQVIRQN